MTRAIRYPRVFRMSHFRDMIWRLKELIVCQVQLPRFYGMLFACLRNLWIPLSLSDPWTEKNLSVNTPRLLNFRVFPVVGNFDDHNANVMVIGMMEDVSTYLISGLLLRISRERL